MNRNDPNAAGVAQLLEEPSQSPSVGTPPSSVNSTKAFVPSKQGPRTLFKENSRLVFIGAGIVLVLLLLAFNGISRHAGPTKKGSSASGQVGQKTGGSVTATSVTPILDTARTPLPERDGSLVNAEQIGRAAIKVQTPGPAFSLGDVRPFDNSQWSPPPYQPGSQPVGGSDTAQHGDTTSARNEHDLLDKASLIFVRSGASPPASQKAQDIAPDISWRIGLPPGTRLRARLESWINTAAPSPVVAVVEYNYEQDGEIVVPAGSKVLGHLESADRSGYLAIHFEALQMPDGSSLPLEAFAADLQLRPLRGKVEGRHAGKSVLVRSLAGLGGIAAALVGRGSLTQPLSEADMLRERAANNIGQVSDQTVTNLAVTERTVVWLPADTEIYVILQKAANENAQPSRGQDSPAESGNIEELRQLLQLQRQLNQGVSKQAAQ
ncbi:MAG TPA: TrbI/VirB10 family protein [Candidatus Angelobacter sp.]|nr:TrbI/VirB10 family protein [Candidatus Angelobacter sp.]